MANCYKKEGDKDVHDPNDPEKLMCYMMRRRCAIECTTNGYGGTSTCDVRSLFTLNMEVDSKGSYATLDCVCRFNEP